MSRLTRTAGLLVTAMTAFAVTPLAADDIGDRQAGGRLAEEVCSECHAVAAGDYISINSSAPSFQEVANQPEITALALGVWFRTPHPTMPNFVLGPDETANLIAYILSLRAD